MDMQNEHAAWSCLNMQHVHANWICSVDMQHGHSAWTCSVDVQQGQAAWTYMYSMDMQHRHAARTCIQNIQQGHAASMVQHGHALTCKMLMQHRYCINVQHGHAAETCSKDILHLLHPQRGNCGKTEHSIFVYEILHYMGGAHAWGWMYCRGAKDNQAAWTFHIMSCQGSDIFQQHYHTNNAVILLEGIWLDYES